MMARFFAWFGTNQGRIATGIALVAEIAGEAWNVHLRQSVDLMALGGGLAAILTASAALLAAPPAAKAMLTRQQVRLRAMPPMRDEGDIGL